MKRTGAVAAALCIALTVAACGDRDDVAAENPDQQTATSSVTDDPDPIAEPEYFGTATVASAAYPDCDAVVAGDAVTVRASGYLAGAEVVVSLQLVDGEPELVATVDATDGGSVAVPVTLPNAAAGAIGGFEMIGEGPDGLLLNEALIVFGEVEACDDAES